MKLKKKKQKKYFNVGIGKMKTKTLFVLFSNARSILELMLCNRNLTKLGYQTLLSSNGKAWSLKLSEHLKKRTTFSIKIRLKRTIIRQLKMNINQCKKKSWEKKHIFCKNVLLYIINNISMVLKIGFNKFSSIVKTMSRNTFPESQPDSAS